MLPSCCGPVHGRTTPPEGGRAAPVRRERGGVRVHGDDKSGGRAGAGRGGRTTGPLRPAHGRRLSAGALPLVRPRRGLHGTALADAGGYGGRRRRRARFDRARRRTLRAARGHGGGQGAVRGGGHRGRQPRTAQCRRHGAAGGHLGLVGGLAGRCGAAVLHLARPDGPHPARRLARPADGDGVGPRGRSRRRRLVHAVPARWTGCLRRSTTGSPSSAGCSPGRRRRVCTWARTGGG